MQKASQFCCEAATANDILRQPLWADNPFLRHGTQLVEQRMVALHSAWQADAAVDHH